jgi:hypothetical protein
MSTTPNIIVKRVRIALLLTCWVLRLGSLGNSPAADAEPIVSATLNGSSDAVLFLGQAGVFEVEIAHPDMWEDTLEPIRIELANGVSWTNAVKCNVFNAAGDAVTWPLWMRPATNQTITLDQNQVGRLYFLISPQDTLALAPGNYTVQFILDTQANAAAGAWAGMADSIRMDVSVLAEPANLTDVQLARRAMQLAQYYALKEDYSAALNALDLLLATQPRSLEALRMKAAVLEATGNATDALTLLDNAFGIFTQDNPNPPEPPRELLNQLYVLQTIASPTVVRITTATAVNGELRIEWGGQDGASYRVESSANFHTWQSEATGLVSAAGTVKWSGPVGPGSRFFRVVVE